MHVVFRESHGLDEVATPFDPGQTAADLVVLSFSDSDLGAFAAGWHRGRDGLPSLRLCNLIALKHPVSVDQYAETVLSGAKAVLVRLIGGEGYWPYGLATLQDMARRQGLALAILPADGRPDPRLDELSTVPVSTLRRLQALCDAGGEVAAHAALAQLTLSAGLYAGPVSGLKELPQMGLWCPDAGILPMAPEGTAVPVIFYRSYLTAADTDTVAALIRSLRGAGFTSYGVFAPSLKAEGVSEWMAGTLGAPAAILNLTAFSARDGNGTTPFDHIDAPVFQAALSTARRRDWAGSDRGLSPSDLAMHVVLPEVDGRIFAGVASFKQPLRRDPDLQWSRFAHRADSERIAAITARIKAWHGLRRPPAEKRVAMVLSTYPGRTHQAAHAVGLDALASAEAMLADLASAGYRITGTGLTGDTYTWPLESYLAALQTLPQGLQDDLAEAWGPPKGDFTFTVTRRGAALVALQPDRDDPATRADSYHDLTRTPCHAYVAFYLWVQGQADALVHVGAHGTLEWLPGKSVALSGTCWPEALTGALPVIYPFIVNDPGEAAQARRRIGAVTLGHMPPPLTTASLPENLAALERLLDEYSTADGLDPSRRTRLIADIRDLARAAGVEEDLAIPLDASAAEAIPQIDRFVCDLKESRFGEGLHIYGRGQCGTAERDGLITALAGRKVAAGPSGSPARGRHDVLPTGRNMYATDPRAVPSPAAHAQGIRLAEELLRRHLQDYGDWPSGLVIDLWGSATMRTAGEDFAMALHLAGLAPLWDGGRVSGYEVIPPALLDRPRIDVTLRVSGLFRDIFPGLAQMFEAGAEALAQREDGGPYCNRAPRVFGPRPSQYGLGMDPNPEFTDAARDAAGAAWLAASEWAIGADGESRPDRAGLEARLKTADAFVHTQDLAESDLLLAADYAGHEAGIAAAKRYLGMATPALYHLDNTNPETPSARPLTEEIARIVRARASNPVWIDGMCAHGFRGAAEITATAENMAAFAHMAGVVPPHLFDLYHEATLGRRDVVAFMEAANPAALSALQDLFRRLAAAGLWQTRSNSIAVTL
ncbi:cobaltochelatase subunit CobN [Falsirhodobacter sp. alg1]|uniref:cobaltochelatase subunit CobN n=1 Tax=Falsirhodobacter sp. alg1 TaxID=1472418 RepID=UPI00078891A6|nr:cobaltochelatase subunit CobN [Falsirhodobacter sp. alg1]